MMSIDRVNSRSLIALATSAAFLTACGGGGNNTPFLPATPPAATTPPPAAPPPAVAKQLNCDDSIKTEFKPDSNTEVIAVKQYKTGDLFPNGTIQSQYSDPTANKFKSDLCLVKLRIGPPTIGPADAPSTSAGIGIEVWLPEKSAWNERAMGIGGTGWTGSEELDPTKISSNGTSGDTGNIAAPNVAAEDGFVTATTDTGHGPNLGGSWGLLPDGTLNTKGFEDASVRSLKEQAVKMKALATAYYGKAPKYMYFNGASGGGRQGMKIAQSLPEQYDGILAGVPGFYWTQFALSNTYVALVTQRDLGGVSPTPAQTKLVGNAAIASCDVVGGKHLGFILDNKNCRYDPTKDLSVLCVADGGTNATAACVTKPQALAMNKAWYGPTTDGSVPDPAVDNGMGRAGGNRKWYGYPRGSDISFAWGSPTGNIGGDTLALVMLDPTLSVPSFKNATGSGQDGWKSLSYAELARAMDIGVAFQPQWSYFNANSPDLNAFKARGGKLIVQPTWNDSVIAGDAQAVIHYYDDVSSAMGGTSSLQSFFRVFIQQGLGHGPQSQGTTNPDANPPVAGQKQLRNALIDWVEKATPPDNLTYSSPNNGKAQMSLPMCAHPATAVFQGGDPLVASSYKCQ